MRCHATVLGSCLLALFFSSVVLAQNPQSPQVQTYLQQASQAGERLEAGDLAGVEKILEPGFNEIALMMSTYRPDERTNAYLRQRGWGHLVWTQLMFRLLAIRDGLYDHELEFAECVAVEEVAEASLQTVQISHTRLQILLAAIDKMDLGEEINRFAQAIFEGDDNPADYRALVTDFEARFTTRRKAVMVRLATGIHRAIVDPAALPHGTQYAQAYEEHRQRMAGENRIDEVLNRMAATDADEIQRLADVIQSTDDPVERDTARNELKLQLILMEDSLDAFTHDASVADIVRYVDRMGALGYLPYTAYPDDIQSVMALVHTARRKVKQQSRPENLRGLYTVAELVRE